MARPLRFGISLVPTAATFEGIVEQVRVAEEAGLDLVGIQDHPYQRRFLDAYSLLANLLARTDRIRFFPDVTSLAMRDPAMIAKAAASMDVMSGGRFELGLGAGNFWDAVEGMGRPKRTNPQAFAALEEAIAIIRAALDVGPEKRVVRGPGPFHPIPGYPAGPPPAHRVGIWLGVYRSRGLRLVARKADGWIPSLGYVGLDDLQRASEMIDAEALAAGRDPDDITRLLNVGGVIGEVEPTEVPLTGPVDHWIETLARWATEIGIDSFVVYPDEGNADQVRRFAAEVAPAVRERLGR
jgi:alkanesulfonate monooxygenase SsuD/methylene tetrahydromethanopterin reductase-like flavin-dependent oxidoreductase (luciferase family)